ncbi:MAG TPA: hypothetical protein PKE12_02000 [Kiritimatiellia bacterium]|nr:hypothetical protein [Kiritimatiellia bacterium]
MKGRQTATLLALAAALAGAACSRERTRVIEEPAAPREDPRDYKGMLERVRNRQGPVQAQQELEDAIRRFQHDLARLPTNLMELVSRRYMPELKPAPEGHAYSYDPVHGNVAVVPVTPDGLYRLPAQVTNQTRLPMREPAALPRPQ